MSVIDKRILDDPVIEIAIMNIVSSIVFIRQ